MRPCRPILFLICLGCRVFSQEGAPINADSLKRVLLRKDLSDQQREAALHELARSYLYAQPDTMLVVAQQELKIARGIGDKRYEAMAFSNIGLAQSTMGKLADALESLHASEILWMELVRKRGEPADRQRLAQLYNNTGTVFKSLSDYPRALDCFFKSLRIKEELKDTAGIARSYGNIGVIYQNTRDFKKSLAYYLKCLAVQQVQKDSFGLGITYGNIGGVFEDLEDYDKAIAYQMQSLGLKERTRQITGVSSSYNALGALYEHKGDLPKALEWHRKAFALAQQLEDLVGIAMAHVNIGRIQLHLGDLKNAEKNLQAGMRVAKEAEAIEDIADAQKTLSEVYEKTCRFKEAFLVYQSYIGSRDSIYNEENTKKSVRSEMTYEFARKEAFAQAEQEKKDALARADKKKQSIIIASVSGFGLIILVFALFAWRSFLNKKKANLEILAQKKIIEEKQKEILDSIHYARRIQASLMPTERYMEKKLLQLIKKNIN